MAWKIVCVDHVGVAVKDLAATKAMAEEVLGIHPTMADETVEDQHVTTSFFKPSAESEACELEFLGSTTPDGPIARYIEKNGGNNGYQHVALRVNDIAAALEDLQARGIRVIDKKWRVGAGGCHIAFLHPKATTGLLIELTERHGGPSF